MKQTQTPLYATLLYDVRRQLDVSVAEYFYLDMVHKLSYDRWCSKSLEHCAGDIGITKRGVVKMRDRLLNRGLLKKNMRGHLKVTPKYTEVAVNKVHRTSELAVNLVPRSVNLVPRSVNLVPPGGELSSTKNNNRYTQDFKQDVDNSGYNLARRVASSLKR